MLELQRLGRQLIIKINTRLLIAAAGAVWGSFGGARGPLRAHPTAGGHLRTSCAGGCLRFCHAQDRSLNSFIDCKVEVVELVICCDAPLTEFSIICL